MFTYSPKGIVDIFIQNSHMTKPLNKKACHSITKLKNDFKNNSFCHHCFRWGNTVPSIGKHMIINVCLTRQNIVEIRWFAKFQYYFPTLRREMFSWIWTWLQFFDIITAFQFKKRFPAKNIQRAIIFLRGVIYSFSAWHWIDPSACACVCFVSNLYRFTNSRNSDKRTKRTQWWVVACLRPPIHQTRVNN